MTANFQICPLPDDFPASFAIFYIPVTKSIRGNP